MGFGAAKSIVHTATGRSGHLPAVLATVLLAVLLAGCTSTPRDRSSLALIEPLQLEDRVLTLGDVAVAPDAPDLLALDEQMRDFVETYAGTRGSQHTRLLNLHQAMKSGAMLDMQYDPFAEGSASDAFHRGSANCLSYAHLFVALAREAGLDARYQWLEVRPQWTRMGERVAVRLHVNALVRINTGERFMVDIDPLPSRDVANTRLISDSDAEALYHNNIAMDAFADDDLETAWVHMVKALQLSPNMQQLWVNIGAIYRRSGQLDAAERSYFQALVYDRNDRSAMNNLVILYEEMGRESEKAYWVERVERYRNENPYYHAWLGDKAAEEGDWGGAREHYDEALERKPGDSRLLYAAGLIRYQLGDLEGATVFITEAMEAATLRGDVETYRVQLEAVRREQLAQATPR